MEIISAVDKLGATVLVDVTVDEEEPAKKTPTT